VQAEWFRQGCSALEVVPVDALLRRPPNHYALKFLLNQHLSTIPQHTWVSKLFGYDFNIVFNPSKMNTVADALSRRNED
jgi:hypothetical protein